MSIRAMSRAETPVRADSSPVSARLFGRCRDLKRLEYSSHVAHAPTPSGTRNRPGPPAQAGEGTIGRGPVSMLPRPTRERTCDHFEPIDGEIYCYGRSKMGRRRIVSPVVVSVGVRKSGSAPRYCTGIPFGPRRQNERRPSAIIPSRRKRHEKAMRYRMDQIFSRSRFSAGALFRKVFDFHPYFAISLAPKPLLAKGLCSLEVRPPGHPVVPPQLSTTPR